MPTDTLANLPPRTDVFLDSNIFIYAFTLASTECADLLARCARGEVFGVTSHEIVNEVTHRLMLFEAYKKGLISKPRADELKGKPNVVRTLTDYWGQVLKILDLGLTVLPTEESTLSRAQIVRTAHGLMTLDSVVVATMEDYGIQHIATHDSDFERVISFTVFRPTDIT